MITVANTDIPTATNPPSGTMLRAPLLASEVEVELLVALALLVADAVLGSPLEMLDKGVE